MFPDGAELMTSFDVHKRTARRIYTLLWTRLLDISFHSALKLVIDVIHVVNPAISNHMLRTACIAQELAVQLDMSRESQRKVFVAALVHDIGMIGDDRRLENLDDIDFADDPHQTVGYQMLYDFNVFKSVKDIIRNHHKHLEDDTQGTATLEQYVVAFADCFERVLPEDNERLMSSADEIVSDFNHKHQGHFPEEIYRALNALKPIDYFWFQLSISGLPRVVDMLSPIKMVHLDIDDFREICLLLARIVDKYSSFTMLHSIIVGVVARRLAGHYGMALREQKLIEMAGFLHDLGKIYIPINIIDKAHSLNKQEFALMRSHSYKTGEILSEYPELSLIAGWAANHHERLDGSGYPYHLTKAYLDIPSRILAVADVYTALTEDRPYREALPAGQALKIMKDQADAGILDLDIYQCLAKHVDDISGHIDSVREIYRKKGHRILTSAGQSGP